MHTNHQGRLNYGSQSGTPEAAIFTSDQKPINSKFTMMMVLNKSSTPHSVTITYMQAINPKRISPMLC